MSNTKLQITAILFFFILVPPAINGGEIYFQKETGTNSSVFPCHSEEIPVFSFRKDFFSTNSYPYKQISSHSEILGKRRFQQLICFREFYSGPELKTFNEKFQSYRNLEIENIELFGDFLRKYEKENKFTPADFQTLTYLLDKKKDLYYILFLKSQRFVIKKENILEIEFKSLYESILQNHLEILATLPPELRNEIIEILNKM